MGIRYTVYEANENPTAIKYSVYEANENPTAFKYTVYDTNEHSTTIKYTVDEANENPTAFRYTVFDTIEHSTLSETTYKDISANRMRLETTHMVFFLARKYRVNPSLLAVMGKGHKKTVEFVIQPLHLLAYACFVGLPRFELGQTEPKSVVLPLHHSPNAIPLNKAVQRYVFHAIKSKYFRNFFTESAPASMHGEQCLQRVTGYMLLIRYPWAVF